MTLLSLVPQLAALFRLILNLADQRQHQADRLEQKKLGRQEALLEALKDVQNLVSEALQARDAFHERIRDDPERLHNDDGFKRSSSDPKTGSDVKPLDA